MKSATFLLVMLVLGSCNRAIENNTTQDGSSSENVESIDYQTILDSANVSGSILIYDTKKDCYTSNDFNRAKKGFIPASTFKIPNSIVALELGNANDENTILKWDGVKRRMDNWNQDLTLAKAYAYSCVPCYQELARKAGVQNMNAMLSKIEYPGMVFDSTDIALFWLEGESKISQMQQIDFLRKLHNKELPLKESTYDVMKRIMLYDKDENYAIYAKTGMSIRDTVTYGWFVGYVETNENSFYFATNIAPGTEMDVWGEFVPARADVTYEALKTQGIIQ